MKPHVIGNWKMNLSTTGSVNLVRGIMRGRPFNGVEVVICPSFTSISAVAKLARGTSINVGAQDVASEESGACTGQISAAMLRDGGCRYVIVGHSERRQNLGESDELIRRKVMMAIKHNLVPVLCVGESIAERRLGRWRAVVIRQLKTALKKVTLGKSRLIVAYEPIWAIGSGKIVSATDARLAAREIRQVLRTLFGPAIKNGQLAVIYGGSVSPANVTKFVGRDIMDGVLVGTDSLQAVKFNGIIKQVTKQF